MAKFIDLFAGCGGLSLGLVKAGWRGIFAVEKNEDAFRTLKHNLCGGRGSSRYDWPTWLPCTAHSTADLLANYADQLLGLRGKVDLIAGGPPCQGFSFAGRRDPNDPRNQLKNEYINIVDIVRPKYLLFENVKGFSAPFKNSAAPLHSEEVCSRLEGFEWGGYHVYSQIINASLFGVPQPRARFILIAVRKDLGENVLSPFNDLADFARSFKIERGLNGHEITVKEAISDLEVRVCGTIASSDTPGFQQINYDPNQPLSAYQKLMRKGCRKSMPPNSLRLANHRPATTERFNEILSLSPKGSSLSKELRERYGMKKQCFTPLHPDQLCKTITTLPDDLLHYSEPRILTVRENARIQSFPDNFEFLGKYTTGGDRRKVECPRYTQVGNAVPPLMAEALGLRIVQLNETLCK